MIAGDSFIGLSKQVDEPYRAMVTLIAATGLRIGELLAMRWRALDLDLGTLTVRESVFEGQFQIYTHVVDSSHRQVVEALEERLFAELDPNGPKLAIAAAPAEPASAGSSDS
jgi:site-specific recombinase XerC